jgi:hypothetical protein
MPMYNSSQWNSNPINNPIGNYRQPSTPDPYQQYLSEGHTDDGRPAYEQFMDYQRAVGDNKTNPLSLDMLNTYMKNAYNTANSSMMGQQRRAMGLAGQQGSAQGYAMGLNNPNLLSERARSMAGNQWADAGSNLNAQYMMGLSGNPLKSWQTELQSKGQSANIYQNYMNYLLDQQKFQASQSNGVGNFFGGLIGDFASPFLGAFGKKLGGGGSSSGSSNIAQGGYGLT